jgi:hypothetical protein
LNIAIQCGIMNLPSEPTCSQLQTKKQTFIVSIFPNETYRQMDPEVSYALLSKVVFTYNRTQNIHYQLTNQPMPSSLTSSIVWNPLSDPNHPSSSLSPSYNISLQYPNHFESIQIFPISSPHSVCVVQTFRNHMTPPMLYLFIEYYLSIGWNVILFDRHGFHQDLIRQRYHSNSSVIYYPFTINQLLFPDKYPTPTANTDEVSFISSSSRLLCQVDVLGVQVLLFSWSIWFPKQFFRTSEGQI